MRTGSVWGRKFWFHLSTVILKAPGSYSRLPLGAFSFKAIELEKWTDIAEGQFEPSQDIENTRVLAPKKRPPNPSRFKFEKVNECTWKLTNGEMTNVPASHGQWGGYRTGKAIAWVLNVAPNAFARCGDQTSNPAPLAAAKAAAMAMARGGCGDYAVSNPISHLNGLTAILPDRGSDEAK